MNEWINEKINEEIEFSLQRAISQSAQTSRYIATSWRIQSDMSLCHFVPQRLITRYRRVNKPALSCHRNSSDISEPRRYSLIFWLGVFTVLGAFLVLRSTVFVDSRAARSAGVLFAPPSVTLTESLGRHVSSWCVITEACGKSHLPVS